MDQNQCQILRNLSKILHVQSYLDSNENHVQKDLIIDQNQCQILSNLSKILHVQSYLDSNQNVEQNNLIIDQKTRLNT